MNEIQQELCQTHAACCQLRFLASRELWLGWFRWFRVKKTAISAFWHRSPFWWGTHHNKLPIHRVNDPNHLGYLHSITQNAVYFFVWAPPLWDPWDPDRIRVRVPRVLANPEGIIGFNLWRRSCSSRSFRYWWWWWWWGLQAHLCQPFSLFFRTKEVGAAHVDPWILRSEEKGWKLKGDVKCDYRL